MTQKRAITVLEGLEMKYQRLGEQAWDEFNGIHSEIAQALKVALEALEGGHE